MKALSINFHPEAINEARVAREWYEERNPAAAAGFLSELERAIEQISRSPDVWPPYLHSTRRFLLHRYPFSVIYRKVGEGVQVVAVAHAKRRPGNWYTRS